MQGRNSEVISVIFLVLLSFYFGRKLFSQVSLYVIHNAPLSMNTFKNVGHVKTPRNWKFVWFRKRLNSHNPLRSLLITEWSSGIRRACKYFKRVLRKKKGLSTEKENERIFQTLVSKSSYWKGRFKNPNCRRRVKQNDKNPFKLRQRGISKARAPTGGCNSRSRSNYSLNRLWHI